MKKINKSLLTAAIMLGIAAVPESAKAIPVSGQLNRLVVLARFKDDPAFQMSRSDVNEMLNGDSPLSVKSYFNTVSNGKLTVDSKIFPVGNDPLEMTYCYYCYDSSVAAAYPECKSKEVSRLTDISIGFVIRQICDAVENDVNADDFDLDKDGFIDDFVIILRGGGRGTENGIHSSHTGTVSDRFITNNGEISLGDKRVRNYTILFERTSLATQCRYLLSNLGFPWLYLKKTGKERPVGTYDVMDGPELTLPLIYNRHKYSGGQWIGDIPVADANTTYTLQSADKPGINALRIPAGDNGEYFMAEYRDASGNYTDESGLLIYRVAPIETGTANDVPEVYICRSSEKGLDEAYFGDKFGRTAFNTGSDPKPVFSNGNTAPVDIHDIVIADGVAKFTTGDVDKTAVESIGENTANRIVWDRNSQSIRLYGDWIYAEIFNASGASMLRIDAPAEVENIDIHRLPSGIYIITASSLSGTRSIKIIK